jgi:hypothetical protein
MKTKSLAVLIISVAALGLNSCSKSSYDTGTAQPVLKLTSVTYPLSSVTDPAISGTATLQKINNQAKLTIELSGTMADHMYPAHIHFNSVAIGGGIAISLSDINGSSGKSVTIINSLDNGTPITYEQLLNFNGYINVHLSATQLGVIVAQGNIGSNF